MDHKQLSTDYSLNCLKLNIIVGKGAIYQISIITIIMIGE